MAIRILVNGASGKMGAEACMAIKNSPGLQLVGMAGRGDDLSSMIKNNQAQVVVDFTIATTAFDNAAKIIAADAHPVIGTSGLSPDQLALLTQRCAEKKLGGIVAPNFSIGAVLLMRCAKECARYFPDVEILELHHNQKIDAPSGTALHTAEIISAVKAEVPVNPAEKELHKGARGARYQGIPIHSIRLPGLVAHEEVIFGGMGQTLTLRHDTLNRSAFMPGVCLACHKVLELETLVYGLEHIL
ncbi:MAG TPA: 4-hydroxy-tetrahydrodipicolinate reductase [Gammaproteobacteria bacterium]|nr:4-hydroxy-tetrahydrodipicolinate reductase [Gammaproteobacteria bacterium]